MNFSLPDKYIDGLVSDPPNALLLVGVKGSFKTEKARNYVGRVLNDMERVENNFHPDVYTFGLEGDNKSIKIDDIRELIDFCNYAPVESKWKFFIIKSAEKLTKDAASALLKEVEEPKIKSRFIFITSNPFDMLNTLKSRCVRIDVPGLTPDQMKDMLKEDGFDDRVEIVVNISHGSFSLARSIYEQGLGIRLSLAKSLVSGGNIFKSVPDDLNKDAWMAMLDSIYFDLLKVHNGKDVFYNIDINDDLHKISHSLSIQKVTDRYNSVRRIYSLHKDLTTFNFHIKNALIN